MREWVRHDQAARVLGFRVFFECFPGGFLRGGYGGGNVLGAVAGLMGGALASAFSRLLLRRLLDAKLQFDLLPNLGTIVLTAVLAIATGWLVSAHTFGQRPMEVLRDE